MSNYYQAKASGAHAVKSFFKMTTDLSKVEAQDVYKTLADISNNFRILKVVQEKSVKEFVEEKTGKPYIIGSAFYQLMKPEVVQTTKQVLIMEKGKKTVWGGSEARKLIGLPNDKNAKVNPGNHSNFDIFVQSTSVNRKLPRGTSLLLDLTRQQDLQPTWDHTKVQQTPSV